MFDEERNNRGRDRRRNWNDEMEDRPDSSSPKHEKRQPDDETWDEEIESRWKESETHNNDKEETPQMSDNFEPNPENNDPVMDTEVANGGDADENEPATFDAHEPSDAVESSSNQYQEASDTVEENLPETSNASEPTSNAQEENVENQEGGTTPLFDE